MSSCYNNGWITHFASRDAIDIDTFSVAVAEQLYEELEVRDPADLYDLQFDDLIRLAASGIFFIPRWDFVMKNLMMNRLIGEQSAYCF